MEPISIKERVDAFFFHIFETIMALIVAVIIVFVFVPILLILDLTIIYLCTYGFYIIIFEPQEILNVLWGYFYT